MYISMSKRNDIYVVQLAICMAYWQSSYEHFNFLGITLDNHLNWIAYIYQMFWNLSRKTLF